MRDQFIKDPIWQLGENPIPRCTATVHGKNGPYPVGLFRFTEMENLTRGLVARGYDDDSIKGFLGENLPRVFKNVWND